MLSQNGGVIALFSYFISYQKQAELDQFHV